MFVLCSVVRTSTLIVVAVVAVTFNAVSKNGSRFFSNGAIVIASESPRMNV